MTPNPVRRAAGHAARATWILVLAAAAGQAHAALDQWGAFASGFVRQCPTGLCGNAFVQNSADDAPLGSFASVAMTDPNKLDHPGVDFAAQSTLVGDLELPELKALAVANRTDRYLVSSAARATQGYQFTGTEATSYTLDVAVNGTLTGNGSLSGFVNIYDAEGFNPSSEIIGTRLAGSFFNWTANGAKVQPAALSFTLQPGDEIYIRAELFAGADSRNSLPSSADAFHTLTMGFQNPAGLLQAVLVPVPEPASLSLLGAGLAALAWRRRPRRD